jgi:hypothetical protein
MAEPQGGSGTPKKPKVPKDERPQRERFIETARAIGVDETGAEFERAIGRIVPARANPKK